MVIFEQFYRFKRMNYEAMVNNGEWGAEMNDDE